MRLLQPDLIGLPITDSVVDQYSNVHGYLNVSKLRKIFARLWVPSLFFVLMLGFSPIARTFEFDTDEGINLIKALLYSEGFSLYTEIPNDQPPFFTVLLSHWFHLFGQTVLSARILTLLFSTLLIWAFYQTLYIYLGSLLASISTVLLIVSCEFTQLSVSVMIGLPSLSLAMLSIYTLTLYKQKRNLYFLLASGTLLALSLQTKLFTIFLVPLMILYLLDFRIITHDGEAVKRKLIPSILLWMAALFVVYSGIGIAFHSINYSQLIKPHVSPNLKEYFVVDYLFMDTVKKRLINRDYIATSLAIFGVLAIFIKKQWSGLFPLAWFVTACIVLFNHEPVWYHHYQLLSIPLCWLAAYGVTPVFNFFRQNLGLSKLKLFKSKKIIFISLSTIFLILSSLFAIVQGMYGKQIAEEQAKQQQKYARQVEIVNLLLKNKGTNGWVFTDSPIYAFYADLKVPPEIAVFSIKRLVTGSLTNADLLVILQKYRPEQVFILRFREAIQSDKAIMEYINKNYSKVFDDQSGSYYVLKKANNP